MSLSSMFFWGGGGTTETQHRVANLVDSKIDVYDRMDGFIGTALSLHSGLEGLRAVSRYL